jgi:hypothetical protein
MSEARLPTSVDQTISCVNTECSEYQVPKGTMGFPEDPTEFAAMVAQIVCGACGGSLVIDGMPRAAS